MAQPAAEGEGHCLASPSVSPFAAHGGDMGMGWDSQQAPPQVALPIRKGA